MHHVYRRAPAAAAAKAKCWRRIQAGLQKSCIAHPSGIKQPGARKQLFIGGTECSLAAHTSGHTASDCTH